MSTNDPPTSIITVAALPVGYVEALKQLEQNGGRRTFSNMTYRLPNVCSLYVEERYLCATVRNPMSSSFWGFFFEPEYVRGSRRGLSNLYVDGRLEGPLHGCSEGAALAIGRMLASTQRPANLIICGHFTQAGWFLDSITVEPKSEPKD